MLLYLFLKKGVAPWLPYCVYDMQNCKTSFCKSNKEEIELQFTSLFIMFDQEQLSFSVMSVLETDNLSLCHRAHLRTIKCDLWPFPLSQFSRSTSEDDTDHVVQIPIPEKKKKTILIDILSNRFYYFKCLIFLSTTPNN